MSTQSKRDGKVPNVELDLVAGNAALNFVNTLRNVDGAPLDTLQSDGDVRAWMKKAGMRVPAMRSSMPKGALLQSARELRVLAFAAIQQKKAGMRIHLAALNRLLAAADSHLELQRRDNSVELDRIYTADSAEQLLAPVVEAIADLLAHGDFDLVRQCDGSGCVLWFLDRANGRPRRFCTEETCGTRTRVAAYRAKLAQRLNRVK